MKKIVLGFLSFSMFVPSLVLGQTESFEMAKAETENTISISCNDSFVEGYTYNAYVNILSHDSLSALSLEIHFDEDVLLVENTYNTIANQMYDSSIHSDYVSYTYIFDSFTTDNEQSLFYFNFRIKNPVTEGNYYFDVIVTEAYDSSFNDVGINVSRKEFTIVSETSLKSASAYSNTNSINTSINNEFSFSYTINSYEPSSGRFIIRYDDQLFEFVNLSKGTFFDNTIYDCKTNTTGEIYVSFAAVSQPLSFNLFSVTLRTIANVTQSSSISLEASEMFDSDLNPMTFSANSLTVNISYDSLYEILPSMETSFNIDTANQLIQLLINLESDSHLGAGDFTLSFNKTLVSYVSYEKLFSPTFFVVNDKEAQLDQGQIKFSIGSTTDIIDATNIISFVFSYNESNIDQNIVFNLSGDGLTDSLINPIELRVSGVSFTIDAVDFIVRWSKIYLYMDDSTFEGVGTGRCLSEGLYVLAKQKLLELDELSINNFVHNVGGKYTAEQSRYLAWARACGDETPFAGSGIVIHSFSTAPSTINNQTATIVLSISVISISSFLAVGTLIEKKRKRK